MVGSFDKFGSGIFGLIERFEIFILPNKYILQVKVMCGTAEFVSPEVVSYDYVSSNTDMWSIGSYF